jgi:hypothetical protein
MLLVCPWFLANWSMLLSFSLFSNSYFPVFSNFSCYRWNIWSILFIYVRILWQDWAAADHIFEFSCAPLIAYAHQYLLERQRSKGSACIPKLNHYPLLLRKWPFDHLNDRNYILSLMFWKLCQSVLWSVSKDRLAQP